MVEEQPVREVLVPADEGFPLHQSVNGSGRVSLAAVAVPERKADIFFELWAFPKLPVDLHFRT